MDVQQTKKESGLLSRRFWWREIFAASEGRSSAILYSLVSFVAALLFARTHAVFGAFPFAVAYLCACNRRLPFAFAGACIGALTIGERGYIYCAAYALLIALRLLLSRPQEGGRLLPASAEYFEEEPALRVAVACVSGFSLSIYQLIVGGLSTASLAFALTMILLPTLLAIAYIPYFEDGRSLYALLIEDPAAPNTPAKWLRSLSFAALLATLLLAAGGSALFGISLSLLLAAFGAVLFPERWGLLCGGAVALILSLGTLAWPYIPALAVMALATGLLSRFGLFPALGVACLGGTLAAFAVTGYTAIIEFLPEAIVSVALAWPLYKNLPGVLTALSEQKRRERAAAGEEARRRLPTVRRMQMLSEAYTSLADVFSRLSDAATRPTEGEYREACRAVFAHYCEGCAGQNGCWRQGERNALRAVDCFAEQYARGTPPGEIRLPDSMMRSCGSFPKISADIREACAALEEGKRRHERNGLFAKNYRMTADVLSDAAHREIREGHEDFALGREAQRVFAELGIPVRHVSVFGARRRYIVANGVRLGAEAERERLLRERLGEACHCRLGEAVVEVKGGGTCLTFESARRYAVTCHGTSAARGREISGDAFSTFEGEGDYFYALLSDGMGSGREAAITAGICGAFLHKTLAAGTSKSTALKALNTLLCERGCECSATVDLLEIDLLYGRACFVKSGAAASYVKRGDSLFRIRSGTVPIGILEALDAEKIRFDLRVGDVVILLSDGVSQCPEDSVWLCELLANGWDPDLDLMAEKILEGARTHAGRGDDMTVALLALHEAPPEGKEA